MQNTLQYYERNYDRLQDVLSDIGGISSIVVTLAYFINLLVNNYIILLDTEDFVLSTEQENFLKREDSKKPTIFRRAREIMFPPRRTYAAVGKNSYLEEQPQDQRSSNYQRLMKDGVDIYQNNNLNLKDEKVEPYVNIYLKRNNVLNNYYQNKYKNQNSTNLNNAIKEKEGSKEQNMKIYGKRGRQNYYNSKNNYGEGSSTFKKETNFKISRIDKKESSDDSKPIEKQNFTWFKYIWYMICCGRNDKKIAYYETFRARLISEENIIQNYLDIYKLLKINNIPKRTLFDKES